MTDEMIARSLKALGDPTRREIVEFLTRSCCGSAAVLEDGGIEGPTASEVCCHITGQDKINSTISHHLHELADANLIQIQRRGKAMVCTVCRDNLSALGEYFATLAATQPEEGCCC
ncbi:MAG: winged helix-turn-helix transcriptional regulator [Armatimonadetes bacterium]|nr:winged helix-turn-helix transcriptional regulator [Armatimonadota bacterium]